MKTIKVDYYDEIPTNFTGVVEGSNGDKRWFNEGVLHRLGSPAVEYANGTKEWRVEGKAHRLDGPAWEGADGDKYWYVDDKEVTEQEHDLLYSIMKLKGLL